MELGKAKYGSGKQVFKIKDGDNVFRILPPMGKLARAGKWNQYYRVEWGYKNSQGRNKPFQDVRVVNFKTKMVEVESAAHLRREELANTKKNLVEQLRKNPSNADLKKQVLDITEEIKRYNLDAKYYVNAIDLNGKIGLLKLGSRAFKALKAEIDGLLKSGVDPLGVDTGRFFNFRRSNDTGNFQDTQYQVTVYKEQVTVDGEVLEKAKVHKIDQSIIDRLSSEAFELSAMYPTVTAAQVQRMVNEGATAVDEILGSGDDSGENSDDGYDDEQESSSTSSSSSSSAAAASKASAAPSVETKTEAKAETKAETKVETKAETKTETKAEASASKGGDLSDDEFLKSIGAM